MRRDVFPLFAVVLACGVAVPAASWAEGDAAERVDFARQILPLLSNKCFVCHGPDAKDEDDLRLDSYAAATSDRGGYRAIDPADPGDSRILARIHSSDDPMPPADADKQLTADERQLLSRWIEQGGQYAQHWALVSPHKHPLDGEVPAPGKAIDAYIEARLAPRGLQLAPSAEPAVLARRVALVLTGLPPEPQQLAEFLAESAGDGFERAYRRLVEQLLDSPRYGEHQARYWLDAVRYGDTHGLHLDNRRGIYPYRDWVVRAFNDNLPFDQFITWQLAGDLLPDPTLPQLVATGFVRMNPTTAEGGAIAEEFQAKNNFDRTETLGTVLLGMTLTCARCHTHKYDPIPQTEYYRLLAFFNSTAERSMDGNSYTYGPVIKTPPNQAAWDQWLELQNSRDALLQQWQASAEFKRLPAGVATQWQQATTEQRLKLLADPQGPLAEIEAAPRQAAQALANQFAAAEKEFTTSLVAKDLAKPRATRVLRRGEYNLPVGDPLTPGILAAMGSFPQDAPRNRLGLAQWLTAPDHPLLARVLINRIWQRTFGDGLVRTPEDFGIQGQQPTHPLLLDWLAVEFRQSDWDVKHMLRLMVHSRAFRQPSARRRDVDDPENRLLARGPSYRLDAEVLRDLALWASQLLDPHMGGEGVKPYQPGGMWRAMAHPASNTKQYVRDKGQRLYRRSLYVYWKRTSPHPMMTLFDAPDRESSCVRRSRTSTSLQSLGLLNETQRVEMARTLAQRLLSESAEDWQRLDLLFRLLACRDARPPERKACDKLLSVMRQRYAGAEADAKALLSIGDAPRNNALDPAEHAAWTQLCLTVLASDVAILMY